MAPADAPPDAAARPVLLADAFGPGAPGLHFDGSRTVLHLGALETLDVQPEGRTVLWVARAPHLPAPWGWAETHAPWARWWPADCPAWGRTTRFG